MMVCKWTQACFCVVRWYDTVEEQGGLIVPTSRSTRGSIVLPLTPTSPMNTYAVSDLRFAAFQDYAFQVFVADVRSCAFPKLTSKRLAVAE